VFNVVVDLNHASSEIVKLTDHTKICLIKLHFDLANVSFENLILSMQPT
jgi:hypothetical protein